MKIRGNLLSSCPSYRSSLFPIKLTIKKTLTTFSLTLYSTHLIVPFAVVVFFRRQYWRDMGQHVFRSKKRKSIKSVLALITVVATVYLRGHFVTERWELPLSTRRCPKGQITLYFTPFLFLSLPLFSNLPIFMNGLKRSIKENSTIAPKK